MYEQRIKGNNMATAIQHIIQNHVLGEIFTEFPTNLDTNAFDFFLNADVDCSEDVSMSSLYTEWGYKVCQAYELDNIRAIRGLMQSMYSDLERFKNSLFQHTVKPIKILFDDFDDENKFYEFIKETDAKLYDQGNETEYAIVLTVDTEVAL